LILKQKLKKWLSVIELVEFEELPEVSKEENG